MSKKMFLTILSLLLVGGLLSVGCSCSSSSGEPGEGNSPDAPAGGADPSVSIISVDPGVSVSIKAKDFPADTELTALINKANTEGKDGVVVGTTNSGSTGGFAAVYNIPLNLADESQLVIRLEGGAGYWAYHTFNNR